MVTALSRRLSWSHFVEIIDLKDALQRDFYAEMCEARMIWKRRSFGDGVASLTAAAT
jgi:predicted nuclease of restriction endonuclease-like (RecB) superfamily